MQRGQQRHTVVEASFEWRFSPGSTFESLFSVLDAEGRGSGRADRDGAPLQNIPKAGIHVRLEQPVGFVPGLSYNAAVTARSSKAASADGAVRLGGFALIDVGLS